MTYPINPFNSQEKRPSAPGKYVAKGHDAQLQTAMYAKSQVRLQLVGKEKTVVGLIARRDKFTITLTHIIGDFVGTDEIFYKHAIESVMIQPSGNSNNAAIA